MLRIVNCVVPDGTGTGPRTAIAIDNGRIVSVGQAPRGAEEIDARGGYVVPGLIDLHTHGLAFQAAIDGDLSELARLEAAKGATTFFPTLFSSPDAIAATLVRHRRETDELRALPQVGGFRLESPYLHHFGGGVASAIAPISRRTTDTLLRAGGGHIRIWDVSPELSGAPEEIRYLADQGIVCSLAHTYASIEQARSAVDSGARLVTHLFNTFEVPNDAEPGCYPAGLVDYLLVEDRVVCEIIGDGTHVNALNVEKALRCKGSHGVVFVTDSNYGAGLPRGNYDLPAGWGRVRIDGSNNGVRLIDRGLGLSGSALSPIDSFRNIVQVFGKDILAAVRLCSTNPARLLGLNKGAVEPGRDADLLILDQQLDVQYAVCAGRVLYSAPAA